MDFCNGRDNTHQKPIVSPRVLGVAPRLSAPKRHVQYLLQMASIEVPPFSGSHPTMCVFDGKTLPLHSFGQLEHKDKKQVRQVATAFRDKIGAFAQLIPPLPAAGTSDQLTWWLLCTQCELIKYSGCQLTPQQFGAPPGFNGDQPGRGRGFNGGA